MRLVSALLDYFGHFFRRIIILFRRYGISLRFPSILLVIALILTVLIPGISLAEHFRAICITVFSIVLLESGSYLPIINACINRALAFVFEDRERFRVSSSSYLAASNPLFLTLTRISSYFVFFYFLSFFFSFLSLFFFFFFLFFFLFFFFFSFFYLSISTPSRCSENFSRLIYFQLSNFITFSGNVISSSIFQLYLLISTIQTSLVTSNNIGLEPNGPQAPNLSELPADMIDEIGNRIHIEDIRPILTFCNPCNSACIETTTWSLFPWLMLSDKLDSGRRGFINLCNNKCYLLKLPTIHEKRCWGSPLGWVVTLGADYVPHLVHLMKGKLIDLPPLGIIQGLAGIHLYWFRLVHKFILFKDPSHNLSFLVIAIFGPMNSLAFTRVGGAPLHRTGEGEWVIVANPDNLKFKDVAFFNGQIYGLCDNGMLVCVELDAPGSAEVQIVSPPPEDAWEPPQKLYLVELLGNLFGVFLYGYYYPSEERYKTVSFEVYKFNFDAPSWEEVTDLEDHAVFVGDGNSWCCPTSTIPSRSNCIYFTDDTYLGEARGRSDVGVFVMKTGHIKFLRFCDDNPTFSRMTWVIPTLG